MIDLLLFILAVLASLINGMFLWIVGSYVIDRIIEEKRGK